MAYDLATAKVRLKIADATQDAALQGMLNAALSLAERYCNRGFAYKAERVTFYDGHYASLPMPRFPIEQVIKISNSVGQYHVHSQTGLISLHRPHFLDKIEVDYAGGYKVLPADLELALWEIFDNLWSRHTASATSGAAVTGGGAVKSISSDGARIEFDVSGGAAVATPNALNYDSGMPYSAQSILDLYRREVA